MKKKVSLVSLGCPKNLVDAEVMLGHLPADRFEIVTDEAQADIIIVNTCSFIKEAKEESVETILEVADFKSRGRCRHLVVTGCLPQRYREDLAEELPEVDLFMGTSDAPRIVELLDALAGRGEALQAVGEADFLYDHTTPRVRSSPFYSTYVKIAEGCANHCSYCIIPQLRGSLRSRSIESVTSEVRRLVEAGVKEINLIAQDITAFGADREDGSRLESLLRELVKIDGLHWLRLLYAYPDGISDELLELIAGEEKICKYLDIPLQHIDDNVLGLMNRRVDQAAIRQLLERVRRRIPEVTLRTSFIVGFPGETEEQFARLLDFVNEGHFERVGVFRYSREEGTAAAALPVQIPERVKKIRYGKLMKAQGRVSFRKNRALVGRIEPVLVEGFSEETELLLRGRCIRQAPDVDGQVYITAGQAAVGDIVRLKITDSSEYDLIGEIVEEGKGRRGERLAEEPNQPSPTIFFRQPDSCFPVSKPVKNILIVRAPDRRPGGRGGLAAPGLRAAAGRSPADSDGHGGRGHRLRPRPRAPGGGGDRRFRRNGAHRCAHGAGRGQRPIAPFAVGRRRRGGAGDRRGDRPRFEGGKSLRRRLRHDPRAAQGAVEHRRGTPAGSGAGGNPPGPCRHRSGRPAAGRQTGE